MGEKGGGNIVHDFEAHKTTLPVGDRARSKLEAEFAGTGGFRESPAAAIANQPVQRGNLPFFTRAPFLPSVRFLSFHSLRSEGIARMAGPEHGCKRKPSLSFDRLKATSSCHVRDESRQNM